MKNKKGQIQLFVIGIIVIIAFLLFGGGLLAFNLNIIPMPIWILLIFFVGWLLIRKKR